MDAYVLFFFHVLKKKGTYSLSYFSYIFFLLINVKITRTHTPKSHDEHIYASHIFIEYFKGSHFAFEFHSIQKTNSSQIQWSIRWRTVRSCWRFVRRKNIFATTNQNELKMIVFFYSISFINSRQRTNMNWFSSERGEREGERKSERGGKKERKKYVFD